VIDAKIAHLTIGKCLRTIPSADCDNPAWVSMLTGGYGVKVFETLEEAF
jgi:hypothetical protein